MALVVAACSTLAGTVDAGQVPQGYAEAEGVSCGPRAVYALLRQSGRDVAYVAVRDRMHLGPDGAPIHEVAAALGDGGIECSTRRLDLTDLSLCPTPLILHINRLTRGRDDGHYVIANGFGPEGVLTFDPFLGKHELWAWGYLSDVWSGYAVVPKPALTGRALGFITTTALAAFIFASVGLIGGIWKAYRTPLIRSSRRRTIVGTACLAGAIWQIPHALYGSDRDLRSHSNDGSNAAAILSGLCGGSDSLAPPAKEPECKTFDEVLSLLAMHGVSTSVRRLNYEDLMHHTGPCIVALRRGREKTGEFSVLIAADTEVVTLVRGGSLEVITPSHDEFRRRWTGLALVPARGGRGTAYLRAAVWTGAIGLAALLLRRHTRRAPA